MSKRSGGNDVTSTTLKSALCLRTSPKLRRSSSAPAEVYRNAHAKEEAILKKANQHRTRQHTYSSLVKSDSKRPIRTPILRHTSLSRQNSTILKPAMEEVQVKSDFKPLGIIGEPCRSNKPPNFVRPIYKLPLRRPGLPNPIKVSSKAPLSPRSDAKAVCVPNQSGGEFVGCGCRSVRFNCTDNTVYEYLANDPVAIGVDIVRKWRHCACACSHPKIFHKCYDAVRRYYSLELWDRCTLKIFNKYKYSRKINEYCTFLLLSIVKWSKTTRTTTPNLLPMKGYNTVN